MSALKGWLVDAFEIGSGNVQKNDFRRPRELDVEHVVSVDTQDANLVHEFGIDPAQRSIGPQPDFVFHQGYQSPF